MRYLILLIACLSLNSCFMSKPRRAERKIRKAIKLDPERFKKDTVTIRDTIRIESVSHDTIRSVEYHDTVTVINNDRVHLKYFYDTTKLEIWHEVECKGDTVYLERDFVFDQIISLPSKNKKWIILGISIVCLFLIFLVIKILLRK